MNHNIKKILVNDKELAALYLIVENIGPETLTFYKSFTQDLQTLSNSLSPLRLKTLSFVLNGVSQKLNGSIKVENYENNANAFDIFKQKASDLVSVIDFLYNFDNFFEQIILENMKLIKIMQNKKQELEQEKKDTGEQKLVAQNKEPGTQLNSTDAKIQKPGAESTEEQENAELENLKNKKIFELTNDNAKMFKDFLIKELLGKTKRAKAAQINMFFKYVQPYIGNKIISPDVVLKLTTELSKLNLEELQTFIKFSEKISAKIKRLKNINASGNLQQFENMMNKPSQ